MMLFHAHGAKQSWTEPSGAIGKTHFSSFLVFSQVSHDKDVKVANVPENSQCTIDELGKARRVIDLLNQQNYGRQKDGQGGEGLQTGIPATQMEKVTGVCSFLLKKGQNFLILGSRQKLKASYYCFLSCRSLSMVEAQANLISCHQCFLIFN